MTNVSDEELERLRRQKLLQLRRLLTKKEAKKNTEKNKAGLLNRVFVGRGLEVFNATKAQYPQIAKRLRNVLIQLFSSGRIKQVSGEELYDLLRKMGLRVKLKTKIRIKEHGKMKSLAEKMKE